MITVLREGGFRFVIYLNDHEPAHVHVYGDGEARIDIITLDVLSVRRLRGRDLARAIAVVRERQSIFLQRWNDIHG